MANPASHNEPSAEHVIEAVEAIEKLFNDLLVEKTTYMSKCKTIRKIMADEYDSASNRGISKKLLKTKIKERDLERKIDDLTADLEDDERNEYQMLSEKLGEFGDTPLGAAALARADGKGTQAHAGT
jgi:sugar-specific transcriptional regulator TrmB